MSTKKQIIRIKDYFDLSAYFQRIEFCSVYDPLFKGLAEYGVCVYVEHEKARVWRCMISAKRPLVRELIVLAYFPINARLTYAQLMCVVKKCLDNLGYVHKVKK